MTAPTVHVDERFTGDLDSYQEIVRACLPFAEGDGFRHFCGDPQHVSAGLAVVARRHPRGVDAVELVPACGCAPEAVSARIEGLRREVLEPSPEPSTNGDAGIPAAAVDVPSTRELLAMIAAQVERYVVLPSEAATTAVSLWVAHTWALDGAHATPYLLVVSPQKRSGKSRLLEILGLLVRSPWYVAAASEAAMFRKISADRPTLLLDEIDAIFGAATERTEPLRAVLNAGNRPGAAVARCVGDGANQQVVDFSVYCAKVLAGIDSGRIPDTIIDRSIRLPMKRKTAAESAARFRHRYADAECAPIREAAAAWGASHAEELLDTDPDAQVGLNDRAEEAWEPLFAIADLAGQEWPERARKAALKLAGDDVDEPDLGGRLLAKLRDVFADVDVLPTTGILAAVNADDELPFGGWRRGEGLDPRGLSRLLKPYAIRPRTTRLGEQTAKGYRRDQFEEAFARYLAPPTGKSPAQAEQPSHPASGLEPDVSDVSDVTDESRCTGSDDGGDQ